jgi:hypothetical protein
LSANIIQTHPMSESDASSTVQSPAPSYKPGAAYVATWLAIGIVLAYLVVGLIVFTNAKCILFTDDCAPGLTSLSLNLVGAIYVGVGGLLLAFGSTDIKNKFVESGVWSGPLVVGIGGVLVAQGAWYALVASGRS